MQFIFKRFKTICFGQFRNGNFFYQKSGFYPILMKFSVLIYQLMNFIIHQLFYFKTLIQYFCYEKLIYKIHLKYEKPDVKFKMLYFQFLKINIYLMQTLFYYINVYFFLRKTRLKMYPPPPLFKQKKYRCIIFSFIR